MARETNYEFMCKVARFTNIPPEMGDGKAYDLRGAEELFALALREQNADDISDSSVCSARSNYVTQLSKTLGLQSHDALTKALEFNSGVLGLLGSKPQTQSLLPAETRDQLDWIGTKHRRPVM